MRKETRFLLHVWTDSENGGAWRARLVELASRETRLFADLDALNDYLQDERNLNNREEDS